MIRQWLILAAAVSMPAQEAIPARAAADAYKVSQRIGGTVLAADFHGHTVPAPDSAFVAPNHVVIEVAIYPEKRTAFRFRSGQFTLRINGKTPLVLPEVPGMVASSIKYPSWEGPRGVEASGGIGNAGVILGRDRTPRFPGDRRYDPPVGGRPAQIPGPASGVEKPQEMTPAEWVTKLGFEDGDVTGPAAGLLYFPYRGNLAKIKKLELVFNSPDGEIILWLRQ